ncbi:MAG: hypothetical protein J6S67_19305 [Methanobrevibacter sp.]|nr:hypothetical protein [Methanobrevibacter sp.]
MTTYITIIISAVSVSAAIYFGLKSSRRNDVKDIEEKATRDAVINVKLDDISSDVKDIKFDISATNKKVEEIDKRVVVVEQSAKSAHHRIDRLEGKETRDA